MREDEMCHPLDYFVYSPKNYAVETPQVSTVETIIIICNVRVK